MKVKAWAKLNLNLHLIPKKLENGLFPVKFLNCELDLADELIIKKNKNIIRVICNNKELSIQKNNLVYKAGILLKEFTGNKQFGVEIILKKNIPIKAGFGGGSSDAAATLKALIKFWRVKISKKELNKIAGQLGKDVYYSLIGGLCEVLEDGSKVNKLKFNAPRLNVIIITPVEVKPSTGAMYQDLNINEIGKNLYKFDQLKKTLLKKDLHRVIKSLHNDFESLAIRNFPILKEIKRDLIKNGALNTQLAGSGLSLVGFFENSIEAKKAFSNLKIIYENIIWTKIKS